MAYYAPGTRALMQVSDEFGLRQLYYKWDEAFSFIFVSALRFPGASSEVSRGRELGATSRFSSDRRRVMADVGRSH